ncbi:hypothetical protein MPH_05469, partial [Macrophomina phaseolina MS6]
NRGYSSPFCGRLDRHLDRIRRGTYLWRDLVSSRRRHPIKRIGRKM